MGLTINTPTVGFLSPPLLQTHQLSSGGNLEVNRLYILSGAGTYTLASATNDADTIWIKNTSTAEIIVTTTDAVEGTITGSVTIPANGVVRLVWTTITGFGWAIL